MPLAIWTIQQSVHNRGLNSWNILRLENSCPEIPRVSGKWKVRETALSVNSNKMQKKTPVFPGHDLASLVISSDVSGLIIITFKGLRYFYLWKMVTLRCLETWGSHHRMTQCNGEGERILSYIRGKISEIGNLNQVPFHCTQELYQYIRLTNTGRPNKMYQ